MPRRKLCITVKLFFAAVALACKGARPIYALTYSLALFSLLLVCYLLVGKRGHLYLNVYSVEQRSAYARHIFFDICRGAGAFFRRRAEVAAFARIHGANEHKFARERELAAHARYGNASVLQRLAKHLHSGAGKFGQFVEEQHASVRK